VQNIFGNYAFRSLDDFETWADGNATNNVAPTFFRYGYSFADDGILQSQGGAEFNAFQLGVYGQDEIQLTNDFKLNLGLRLDIPVFSDKPETNEQFNAAYGDQGKTGELPDTKLLISPRVGFNWDVAGDKTLQVRGGTGLFTGRVPFVWVSNQFANNGQLNGSFSTGNATSSATPLTNGVVYSIDPAAQASNVPATATISRGVINVIDPDFRFPQVFRTNLAVDKKFAGGVVATVEGIFSKTYNNVNFINLNRQEQTGFTFAGPDQRPRYTTSSTSPTNSGYNSAGRIDPAFEEIVKLENTDEGYSYNVVLQLQKQFSKGFHGSLAYTYGDSKDLNSGASSVAYSNWQFVNNVNGLNNLSLTRSNYSMGSRIVGLVSYRKSYLNDLLATQVSLFYNGQSGQPFSYRYNGDLNYDGTSNDLIYVPRTAADINLVAFTRTTGTTTVTVTPEEQWAALDAFIAKDSYLKDKRGGYAERNGARMPFQHQFDFRILQEIAVKAGESSNRLQLSLDIINVGNIINSDWGRQFTIANQEFALINYTGLTDADPLPTAVNYTSNTPRFTYNPTLTNNKAWSAFDLTSRWRMQIGIRYIFN
jgi:hypothetical protein